MARRAREEDLDEDLDEDEGEGGELLTPLQMARMKGARPGSAADWAAAGARRALGIVQEPLGDFEGRGLLPDPDKPKSPRAPYRALVGALLRKKPDSGSDPDVMFFDVRGAVPDAKGRVFATTAIGSRGEYRLSDLEKRARTSKVLVLPDPTDVDLDTGFRFKRLQVDDLSQVVAAAKAVLKGKALFQYSVVFADQTRNDTPSGAVAADRDGIREIAEALPPGEYAAFKVKIVGGKVVPQYSLVDDRIPITVE